MKHAEKIKTDGIVKVMKGLKELSKLDLEARRKQYPSAPLHAITPRTFNDRTTNGLTACVLRWLELHGHYATRIATTGRRTPDKIVTDVIGRQRTIRGQWIPGTTKRGTADIHASINGRHCSIEIKCAVTRDRMRPEQRETQKTVRQSGGLYVVVRDFDGFLAWYNEITKQYTV